MKETARELLESMPFDRCFDVDEYGHEELCHATGYAVQFDNETTPVGIPLFWTEFIDSEGNYHYGN